MADLIGQQLGVYRIIKKLGEGGFAEVYLAENIHVENMRVAIKILRDTLPEKARTQFLKEAGTITQLRHPHIIRLLYFDFHHGLPYLVMDYIEESSLRNRYPEGTKLALATIMSYVKQIAGALQYAHDRGIVHRDIKPDNILWEDDNALLVSDFGIATGSYTKGYGEQEKIGTLPYMAPEQFRAKAQSASDQYSLAVVVYEWLCGTPPFAEGDFFQMGFQHISVQPPPLHEKITISPAIEEVVMKALAKEPKDRYENIAAFSTALENAYNASLPGVANEQAIVLPLPASIPPSEYAAMHVAPLTPVSIQEDVQPLNNEGQLVVNEQHESPRNSGPLVEAKVADFVADHDEQPPYDDRQGMPNNIIPLAGVGAAGFVAGQEMGHDQDDEEYEDEDAVSPLPWRQNSGKRNVVGVPYAATGAGTVGGGVGGAVVTPTPGTAGGGSGSGTRKRRRGLLWLPLIALLMLSVLICGGIALAAPGTFSSTLGSIQKFNSNAVGDGTPTGAVTIEPKSALLSNTYVVTGITSGTPDSSRRQVEARQLTFTTQPQSKTVPATGAVRTQGTRATGTLTFYNGNSSDYYVSANVVFTDAQGIQIANDALVAIPAGNPNSGYGHVTVSAHAVNIGANGNIPAGDFSNLQCCGNSAVGISTNGAFTGGQDPQSYTAVQQSDVDNATNPLKAPLLQSALTMLNGQKKANEQYVHTPQCTMNVTSNPAVGAKATSVTVSVTATCSGEVYDQVGVQTIAANLLKGEADKSTGGNYALVGNLVTSITSVAADSKGNLSILVKAEGVWVYQFDATAKTNLAKLIAGKAQNDATSLLLQQAGVSKVDSITISNGGNALPTDYKQITIVVQPVVGIQGTPTAKPPTVTPTTAGS